jgi:hypothetical protein
LDVAFELAALKLAIIGVLDTIVGSSPTDASNALNEWASRSPVPLPRNEKHPEFLEEEFSDKLGDRADEIETEFLAAAGAFLAAKAERLRVFQTREEVA